MRYMALDLGTKTCGIALTDRSNILACPYKTIRFRTEDYEYLYNQLEKIIEEEKITTIVIGKPLNMDGSSGFATNRSDYIVSKFKELEIDVEFVDERLTSVFANKILEGNGKSTRDSKKMVDTLSACLILETFLRRKSNEQK
ncbi:MAG: Holliday junction resolvase RuvX [bacterium]